MTTDASGTLEPGMLLRETYLIHERLASGGMGEVYLATHVRLPGRFAVKVLASRLAQDPNAVARFCREAAIVSVLRHPNIVQVYDFNITPAGVPFLVMECLDGSDLSHILLEQGPMPLGRVAGIVRQIASALESAHARGIVHRDLKPANIILLDWEGHRDFVKVLDFGVSKIRGAEKQSGRWTMLGTPAYMAPEQAQGRGEEIDGRTDQFSLGVLTYVLLTGSDPFPAESTAEILHKIIHDPPRGLAERVFFSAAPIEAVLGRALAKRPGDRFPGVLEFARAFEEAAAHVLRSRMQGDGEPADELPAWGDPSQHPHGPRRSDVLAASLGRLASCPTARVQLLTSETESGGLVAEEATPASVACAPLSLEGANDAA
jgi:serine/threonine protein kinase